MALKNTRTLEHYEFHTLLELKKWLNEFNEIHLDTVNFDTDLGYLQLYWDEETLSDGSHVYNVRVRS